jgi:hypothetical protein
LPSPLDIFDLFDIREFTDSVRSRPVNGAERADPLARPALPDEEHTTR